MVFGRQPRRGRLGGEIPPQVVALDALGRFDNNGNLYTALAAGQKEIVTPQANYTNYAGALPTPQGYTPVSVTELPAYSNPDQSRTKLGVAEGVYLYFQPDLPSNAKWKTSSGGLSSTDAERTWFTAPSNATPNVIVTATYKGQTCQFPPFNVVAPGGYTATIIGTNHYSPGLLGAGMTNLVRILPTDVCFHKVKTVELPCFALNITGYFTNIVIPPAIVGYSQLKDDNSLIDWVSSGSGAPSFPIYPGGFDVYVTNYWQIQGASSSNLFAVIPGYVRLLNSSGDLSMIRYGITLTRSTNDISHSSQ